MYADKLLRRIHDISELCALHGYEVSALYGKNEFLTLFDKNAGFEIVCAYMNSIKAQTLGLLNDCHR